MGLLRMLASVAPSDGGGGRSPDDDFWYGGVGNLTASGVRITPERAMRFSPVFACTRAIADDLASLPVSVFEAKPDGSRREATEHPVYKLLKGKVNRFQTTLQWRKTIQVHRELRGNSYSLIVPGRRGAYDQLIPIHPDRVTVWLNDSYELTYKVRQNDGSSKIYLQGEILHLKGISSDGIVGMSTIGVQAEAIGLGLSAQDYGARFFANDGTPPGVITAPSALKPEQKEALRENVQRAQTGSNRFKVMVLEGGLTYKEIPLKNTDAQFLESRKYSANEICGIFGVPPHRIGILDRATHSNIEHQGIEYVQYCIGPRAIEFESQLNADLIEPLRGLYPGDYYVAVDFDALMRGDLPSRYTAYGQARNGGFLSVNDIRRKENLSPIGPDGDIYLQPANYMPAGTVPAATPPDQQDGSGDGVDDAAENSIADGEDDDDE